MSLSIEQLREICTLLGISPDYAPHLVVKDSDDELVLLTLNDRYLDLTDDPLARTVRGLIWSMTDKRVVCATGVISLITDAVEDELEVTDDGHLHLTALTRISRVSEKADLLKETHHSVALNRCLIMPNYDGVKINVFLYKGKVYFATNGNLYIFGRRQDGSTYRGGVWRKGSITYGEQFELLVGPMQKVADMLFPTPEETYNSPWNYSFYLVHPSSFLNTKLLTGPLGFCIYYGAFDSGSVEKGEGEEEPVDFETVYPSIFAEGEAPVLQDQFPYENPAGLPIQPFVINASNMLNPNRSSLLNLEQANNVLKYGRPDPSPSFKKEVDRQLRAGKPWTPGESLTVTYLPEPSDLDPEPVYQRFRVCSAAFSFREGVHDHTSEFYQRYVQLVQEGSHVPTSAPGQLELLLSRYRALPQPIDPRQLEKQINAGIYLTDATPYVSGEIVQLNEDDMIVSLSYLYVLVSNPHNQGMGLRFLKRFLEDREHVIDWLSGRILLDYPKTPKAADGAVLNDRLSIFYQKMVRPLATKVSDELGRKLRRAKPDPKQIKLAVTTMVKTLSARNMFDLIRLVNLVKGYSTIRISEPTAAVAALAPKQFPALSGKPARSGASSSRSASSSRTTSSSRAASSKPVRK